MDEETYNFLVEYFTVHFAFVVNVMDFCGWGSLQFILDKWSQSEVEIMGKEINSMNECANNPIANLATREKYLGKWDVSSH